MKLSFQLVWLLTFLVASFESVALDHSPRKNPAGPGQVTLGKSLIASQRLEQGLRAAKTITAGNVIAMARMISAKRFEGREAGSRGGRRTAELIEKNFRKFGLAPGGTGGSYYQPFNIKIASPGMESLGTAEARNVIGVLNGNHGTDNRKAIIIGAHYDHLGASEKIVFYGANDNASGVSALLEVANAFHSLSHTRRTLVFVAFDAEEMGKRGSQYFLNQPVVSRENMVLMINLDMIGKGEPDELYVVASHSSHRLHEIHQEMNRYVGLKLIHPRSYQMERSDHSSFLNASIPVIYLFGGADLEFNTPRDTWEKLFPAKLEKATRLAFLTAFYVSEMDGHLDFSGQIERDESSGN